MTVASGQGIVRQTRPKPGDLGRHKNEWWCENDFGDSVLIVCCKTSDQAAAEAAEYFNTLAVDGPIDTIDVLVEGWAGARTRWNVQRHLEWRPEQIAMT